MATVANSNQQQQQQGAGVVVEKKKPVFVKVDQLKPGTQNNNLIVKVLSSNTVLQKGRAASQRLRNTRIAECLVGDETGTILLTARNEQGTFVPVYFLLVCDCVFEIMVVVGFRDL
ncbi:unnamed protein product [Linum tenue]|uniref:Single-stranded DNA binding protein Ssb-like OB fold domain-containing protein n=1 Tax=Linum tenue TaxID=586396 RepID=A0AAV0PDW5_9ROSI|nr:unnamed protein product [Linum tenue]